ncbi:ferredoxin [Frankia sp. CiP1_Cm_nod1]
MRKARATSHGPDGVNGVNRGHTGEMTDMRIVINRSRCSGLGMCESIAEDVFEVQKDGTLRILIEDVDPARREEIQSAVDACPTEALKIVD